MGPCGLSRLWQQNYNLKIKSCLDEAVQILQSFQLSVEQAVTLSSARRKGAKKRKRDRLGPFSNPHEVPVQEAVRNHRACKSPAGNLCAAVQSACYKSIYSVVTSSHSAAFDRH